MKTLTETLAHSMEVIEEAELIELGEASEVTQGGTIGVTWDGHGVRTP